MRFILSEMHAWFVKLKNIRSPKIFESIKIEAREVLSGR